MKVSNLQPPQHLEDLTAAATEQTIHAFVTGRLDVGNALLY